MIGDTVYGAALGEPAANFLQAVGIRARLRIDGAGGVHLGLRRASKLRGLLVANSGASGNAATRLETFAVTGSRFVYGTYADVDGLFAEQVNEQNPRVRKQLLDRAQQIIHERRVFVPVIEPALLNWGGAPRSPASGHRQSPVLRAVRGPEDQEVTARIHSAVGDAQVVVGGDAVREQHRDARGIDRPGRP